MKRLLNSVYVAMVVVITIILMTSCATKKKIEYRDRIVDHYITKEVHDTLKENTTDSVYFEVMVKGDTVYKTKYKEKTLWRDRIVEKHDTCYRDSVLTECKETIKEVTKIPKIYKYSLFFSIAILIFAIIKFVRWAQVH